MSQFVVEFDENGNPINDKIFTKTDFTKMENFILSFQPVTIITRRYASIDSFNAHIEIPTNRINNEI